jgi:hypothetical protein
VLAGAMVEGRITGVPPTVPKGMSCEDVAAAVRIAEILFDLGAKGRRSGPSEAE